VALAKRAHHERMSTTLLPPLTDANDRDPGGPDRPAPPDDNDSRRSQGRGPGRRRLAALLAAAAVAGGSAGAGVVALTQGDGSGATTTVMEPASAVSSSAGSAASGLDAAALYRSASPGVVDITATGTGSAAPGPFGQGSAPSTATGSGFVVDRSGHIVTAAHVIDGATSIKVRFSDGTTRTATLVGQDNATDVAVLKVDPSGLSLHPLTLGSSAALHVGDAVVAIGSPFGYQESLSTGVVSGLDRTIQAPNGFTVAHAVQTDAALNPGNSGGPILDSAGHVVGIADQVATGGSSDQGSGVGFAIPSDLIAAELSRLEAGKTVSHAYLGVATSESTGTTGAMVGSVSAGSPAAQAGLQTGDVVTAADGKSVTGSGDLVSAITAHAPGDALRLTIRRGSATQTLTVTLGTQPQRQSAAAG
jgi:putative serine protease PepD